MTWRDPAELKAELKAQARSAVILAGGRVAHRRETRGLARAPWGDAAAMDAQRLARLRRTIERAARLSPYYRALIGPDPALPATLADLARLPVTSKVDMRASGLDRARPGSRLRRRTAWGTSGSSGEPYVFDLDSFYCARHEAQRAFVYLEGGVAPGARILEVVPGTRLLFRPQLDYPTFRRTVVGYVGNPITDLVHRARPELLYGNRSHLLQIADELDATGRTLAVAHVCSSSETLHPQDEDRLSSVFSASVFEVYGSAEAGNLAFRRPGEAVWTTLEPRVVVEVLDDEGLPVAPGEVGELVVTTLTEPTSPLIRYATGDLARVADGSATGASGLRLAALEGRTSDALVDAAGRRVSMWAVARASFWAAGEMARHVRRWRVHQAADLSVLVSVELAPDGDLGAVTPRVEDHIRTELGPVPVAVTAEPSVHDPAAGKFRAVTSDASPAPLQRSGS